MGDVDEDAGGSGWRERSVVTVIAPSAPRKLGKVPFVELAEGRLQGVVSSSSDIARVYVSAITAKTHGYSCSTNNNRPCGGGGFCKHLRSLVDEAVVQYGVGRVARYLRVDMGDATPSGAELVSRLTLTKEPAAAASVFARFLSHLAYLELATVAEPVVEMHWFPSVAGGH